MFELGRIEVSGLDAREQGLDPFDPGELGTVVAAPAIANALASATGQRSRRLPLDAASGQ
ncbi:MAG: hypothetical protein JKY97_09575 [Citromicrobium sp.]|nr:hypothetical protein [Citromicrobium sp.]